MRYLIAIIFAIVGAALAFAFLGQPVANLLTNQLKFDSPDGADIDMTIFLAVCLVGMLVGWTIGWAIAGPLSKGQRPS